MDFVRPQNNVPVALTLAAMGVVKEGVYGPQKFFRLADGRGIYLDLDVAQKVESLVTVGQPFWLVKRKPADRKKKTVWDVLFEDPAPQNGKSDLERDLEASIAQARNGKPKPPATIIEMPVQTSANGDVPALEGEIVKKAPAWAETLVSHTNELVDAYAACLEHASAHGLSVKSDDVRTLLVTAFINLSQRKRGAA